jgi:hypothetical protein
MLPNNELLSSCIAERVPKVWAQIRINTQLFVLQRPAQVIIFDLFFILIKLIKITINFVIKIIKSTKSLNLRSYQSI